MKQLKLLTAGICMLMPFMLVLAQDPATKTTTPVSNYAFSKGKSSMELMRNFNYDHFQDFRDDQNVGDHNDLYFGLSYNYFVQKNIAVGIDLNANSTGYHTTSDIMSRDWLAKLNFTYGIPLSENINLYGRLGIGLGKEKVITESGSSSTTYTDDLLKYHFDVGLPIRLYNNGNVYFTPKLSYTHLETNYDDGDQTDNGFRLNFGLESYLFCNEYQCDSHHGFSLSKGMYTQGHSYLGLGNRGMIGFMHSEWTMNNSSQLYESDNSSQNIRLNYGYYIIDNFAIGAGLDFRHSKEEPKNSVYSYSSTSYNFLPMLNYNLPVSNGWNNLFLQAQGGFGSLKLTTDDNGNTTDSKHNTTSLEFGIGYNDFFAKKLSLTPMINYQWNSSKNDADKTTKSHGWGFEFGVKTFF